MEIPLTARQTVSPLPRTDQPTVTPPLPALRRLVVWALGSGLVYTLLVTGSRGNCRAPAGTPPAPSPAPDAGAAGVEVCRQVFLGPHPLVYLFLGLLVLWAMRESTRPLAQVTRLRWACVGVAVGCALIAQLAFFAVESSTDAPTWSEDGVVRIPFGVITTQTTTHAD